MSETTAVRQIEVDDIDLGPSRSRVLSLSEILGLYAGSVLTALVISAILVEATGSSWRDVVSALVDGSIAAPGRWGTTLGVMTPMLLVALGTIVSAKAGLVNIGQEGQVLLGAAFASYVGVRLGGPGPWVLTMLLVFGIVGGALWAGIAALLRYWRGVPEVLTTLLMVTIASQLVGYGLKNDSLLLAPAAGRANRNQVAEQLPADTRIPRISIFGNDFPMTFLVGLLLAALLAYLLARSIWGFRIRMLGRNPRTAQRAGVAAPRTGSMSLLISGGFAGLAGGVMLAGGEFGNYQLVPGFSANIGWTGLLVALVARERALLAIPMAFLFASLRTGSGFLAATGVERRITDVVQALLVLALLVPPAILFIRERRRALAATKERA